MATFAQGIQEVITPRENLECCEDILGRFFSYDSTTGDDHCHIRNALNQAGITNFLEFIVLNEQDVNDLVATEVVPGAPIETGGLSTCAMVPKRRTTVTVITG